MGRFEILKTGETLERPLVMTQSKHSCRILSFLHLTPAVIEYGYEQMKVTVASPITRLFCRQTCGPIPIASLQTVNRFLEV
jgi:hypothetical protein